MSIINASPTPPTPPTPQERLQTVVNQQQAQMQQLWNQISSTMNNISGFIYNCPLSNGSGGKFSAQEVFNAYGTNAVDLCKLSDAVLGMVKAYTGFSPTIPPNGVTVTRNLDGTVTIS